VHISFEPTSVTYLLPVIAPAADVTYRHC